MGTPGEEPPLKKHASEVLVKQEPGLSTTSDTSDGQGPVNLQVALSWKNKVKEALNKRKRLVEDELQYLNGDGALLDYFQLCQRAAIAASAPSLAASSGHDAQKSSEKSQGLSDEDKLILAKAKAIEQKLKFKAKWPEPPRRKVHHDYLLEEMTWLATDFRQERKWKMAVAKKVAYACVKFHAQKQLRAERADKDKENVARKKAGKIAKEVKKFWSQIQTLAQHKQQVQVEVEKKKMLGKHLDFLVDQTEKYSTMIAQDLAVPQKQSTATPKPAEGQTGSTKGNEGSKSTEDQSSPITVVAQAATDDMEYAVEDEEEDDEETMEEAEKDENKAEVAEEVNALQAEQDMPIEELLAKYGYNNAGESVDGEEDEEDEDEDEDDDDEEEEAASTEANPEENASKEKEVPPTEAQASSNAKDETVEAKNEVSAEKPSDPNDAPKQETEGEGKAEEGNGISAEAKDVADMARTLAPTGHTLATTQVKTEVPFLLSANLKMREYQHIALDWMVALYDKGLNGILADEMGLGKTIMTISVLAYLACERGIWGPHLIVVPTSLLLNWEIEVKRWCPSFKVLTYYGSQKERKAKRQGWSKPNSFHICITSYKMAVQDQKMFRRKKWKYMILDEAHNIKNFQSQRWQVLLNFRSKRRLLLTGTPLQNNLMELWSLLHFLMPHIFSSHTEFKDWFANPLMSMVEGTSAMNDSLVQRLHSVLRPFILRRLKKDVETQLPNKHEHVVSCRLSKRQRCLYDDFMAAGSTQAKLQSGNLLEVINVLMQLRKVCNHPDLFEERPIVSPFDCTSTEIHSSAELSSVCRWNPLSDVDLKGLNFLFGEFENMSKFDAQILADRHASRKLVVELGESLTSYEEYSSLQSEKREWSSVTEYKEYLSNKRKKMKSYRFSQMMMVNERRCQGIPIYGTSLCRLIESIRRPIDEVITLANDPKRHAEYTDTVRNLVLTPSERVFGRGGKEGCTSTKLLHPMYDLDGREVDSLYHILTNFVCIIPKARAVPASVVLSHPNMNVNIVNEDCLQDCRLWFSSLNDVCRPAYIRQQLYFPDKRLLQYDCGKLQVLDGMLRKLKSEGHRVLLFTQMSKVLDILETFLSFHGHVYIRLDGATKIEMRQKLVERFNQDPKILVFISSTRAGGVGINLTGADTVIFYDSDWNPAMDRQAQDRCHRIGQTREVNIYRLVSESTVEENILKKARQKLQLENLALTDGAASLFNPDLFKKIDVRELFEEERAPVEQVETNPLAHLQAQESSTPMKDSKDEKDQRKNVVTDKEWELAIANAEDEQDVEAMKIAKQEEREEMADFEDEAPAEAGERDLSEAAHDDYGSSKVDAVAMAIESELMPVQRYALQYLENEFEQAGITLVAGVNFDKERWERDQLRRIRDQDADRMYDEDEILYYEVSGCSQQRCKRAVSMLDILGRCLYVPCPQHHFTLLCCLYHVSFVHNGTDLSFAGVRSPQGNKMKGQRPGPPQNKGLKIKFTMPQAVQPNAQGSARPGQGPQAQLSKKMLPTQQGQQVNKNRRAGISAGDVPWTREEEDVLRESVNRFQGGSGTLPIRTWHLHASILNSSIPARGRLRMGKHCMDYWHARLSTAQQGQGNPEGQQKQPLYPPRSQTSEPTRDSNIASIIRAMLSNTKTSQSGPSLPGGGTLPMKQRDSLQVMPAHESHRAIAAHAAQSIGLNMATLSSNSSELIRRILAKMPQTTPSQSQVQQQQTLQQQQASQGQQQTLPASQQPVPPSISQQPGSHLVRGQPQTSAGLGQGPPGQMAGRPGAHPSQPGQGVRMVQPPHRPGAPVVNASAASKVVGAAHTSHAAAMQASRPITSKPGMPPTSAGPPVSSSVVLGAMGAPSPMGHPSVVGMQQGVRPGQQSPIPTSAAGRGVQGPPTGRGHPVHDPTQQSRLHAQATPQQQQVARQAALAQHQAIRAQHTPVPHQHPQLSQADASQVGAGPVPAAHHGAVAGRPGGYPQPLPPTGLMGQHPPSSMTPGMQQQMMPQHPQTMAQNRQRKPKNAPGSSPQSRR
eukprot:767779-Hanusia_phi.AAC.8